MPVPRASLAALAGRFLGRLRFPQLFALALVLFVADLVVPDLIPFVDELLLGIATILLGSLEKAPERTEKPPMKDVTPPRDAPR